MEKFSVLANDVEVIAADAGHPRDWLPHQVEHVGTTVAERNAYVAEARARLRADGLHDGTRYDDDVDAGFAVWTDPDALVVVRGTQSMDPPRVLGRGALRPHLAVCSVQSAEMIDFELLPPAELPASLASMVPEYPPIDAQPHSVQIAGPAPDDEDEAPSVKRPAGSRPDAEGLAPYSAWPVTVNGGFELYFKDRGKLTHAGTVQFFLGDGGGYIARERTTAAGTWLDFRPCVASQYLAQWLRDEIDDYGRYGA